MSNLPRRSRSLKVVATAAAALMLVAACGSGDSADETTTGGADTTVDAGAGAGSEAPEPAAPGDPIVIGFSAPAATHGWMGAITKAAQAEAEKYPEVTLRVAESTNEVSMQISQIETFINDKVDAIVLLPFDGAALTEVATRAMEAGIPVINVDREFSSTFAARSTVLGDNYGMGVSAGTYICEQLAGQPDAVVAEIAGIDSLPLTQDRSEGFAAALADCGLEVNNRVAADFTVQGGERETANLLQAAPKIDAIWNHDDDQGIGVLAAINTAGRSEFFMVGGAGSANMMREIQDPESVVKATVIYPSTQAADGIKLARLVAQEGSFGDLASVGVPRSIQLYAPVVTAENVEQYLPIGFES